MSDTIFVRGLVIHARHGVLEHEAEIAQRFVIDIQLYTDLSNASCSDHLDDTVSYSDVVATATAAFKSKSCNLLEYAAGAVADAILMQHPRIRSLSVTVHKPHAPIPAIFENVGVTISRVRGN